MNTRGRVGAAKADALDDDRDESGTRERARRDSPRQQQASESHPGEPARPERSEAGVADLEEVLREEHLGRRRCGHEEQRREGDDHHDAEDPVTVQEHDSVARPPERLVGLCLLADPLTHQRDCSGDGEEAGGVHEQGQARPADADQDAAEQRAGGEPGKTSGLHVSVRDRKTLLADDGRDESELGGLAHGVRSAQERGEDEQRNEVAGERERGRDNRLGDRCDDDHAARVEPVCEQTHRSGEDDERSPERDEERRDREPRAGALLEMECEGGDCNPVAERGEKDRAHEQLQVAAVHAAVSRGCAR